MSSQVPDINLGYGFEDEQTRQQLELLDDLQKLGVSEYVDLPQLVVVGEQSTGKSSVLQAVTEIPFPVDDNMCTRFATEIVLKRTQPGEKTRVDVIINPDEKNESDERKIALRAWRPEKFDPAGDLTKDVMKNIFDQAEDIIFDENEERKKMKRGHQPWAARSLSSATLQITRSGPNENNFTIVDIPGLIREKKSNAISIKQTADALASKYLQNPRSIVVVVLDITHPDRQQIYQMLDQVKDQENRVIGVVNKCDRKQAQSDAWVFDLIQNGGNSKKYLKEGWYGLRNRLPSELDISDEERDRRENKFFDGEEWSSLDRNKLGRHHLKSALIKMRNRHMKRSVPKLLPEIQAKLDKCVRDINVLGEARTSNQAQYNSINKIATKYSLMAQGALNGHYDVVPQDTNFYARKLIRDDLDNFQREMVSKGPTKAFRRSEDDADVVAFTVPEEWANKILGLDGYKWIRDAIQKYRAKEDVGEINPEVKNQLWKEQTVSWKETASEWFRRVEETIDLVNSKLFEEACSDEELRAKLQSWLLPEFEKSIEDARAEMERIVLNERDAHLFTLHPSKAERQQAYHQARIQAITDKYVSFNTGASLPQATDPPSKISPVPAKVIINSLIYGNAELVGVINTHDSLAAYYDVALYRFIDNFALQVVERHLLGRHGPLQLFNSDYVSKNLYGEDNASKLSDLASEEPKKAKERRDLEIQRKSLEESKKLVQSFKIL
ncbi:P-loop containing nucleoside triphosphate hydrolase protein [Hyaloscypha variabilis]